MAKYREVFHRRNVVFGLILVLFVLYYNTRYSKLQSRISHGSEDKAQNLHKNQCNVKCLTGIPCEYNNEVHLRVIVMTFNRPDSLQKTLSSILNLETLNDTIAVEIWIDRSRKGIIDQKTLITSNNFIRIFTSVMQKGNACVHTQSENANIRGQWMDTWRPKEGTSELGLIIEDDISIAPKSYQWLKMLHDKYRNYSAIAGYTLQMENIRFFGGRVRRMIGPSDQPVFLYPILGTWGYAPHPKAWRDFQDWYTTMRPTKHISTDKIKPYIPGILPTNWYKSFEKRGSQESMWEMWHMKFCYEKKLYTVYSNLENFVKHNKHTILSNNRKERGLHFSGKEVKDNTHLLLKAWNTQFEVLPSISNITHFNYDGSICTITCCFNTSCKG